MNPSRERHAEEIFAAALERPAEDRDTYLRGACDDDPELEAAVRALCDAHERADTLLERPATDHFPELAVGRAPDAWIGKRIGPFVLERAIAAGGMGTVYQAVQDHPQRKVALKITTSGLLTETSLRRFRYEAEILGRLHHEGIAHVYEAGVHEEGSLALPYIAMELIEDARTIVEYACEQELPGIERLSLFARVCDAVHHGHVKGVIHRDVKPGNVLIDAEGNPKVIDFGVARAADPELARTSTLTLAGQVVGTLPYMSPEQCGDDPADVDVRSDVYSLGVLLFELLTGELPHAVADLSVTTALATIRAGRPRKPSSFEPSLRGDLETIVLKALEPDRERRYPSAQDLGADVRRFLSHEPIAARPPSALYQVRMFSRRHRQLFAGLLLLFVVLVAATAVSTGFAVQAAEQRDATETARQEEAVQRGHAEEINTFLQGVLAAAHPNLDPEGDLTVRQLLDQAAARLQTRADHHPLVEAGIRETIGTSYGALGRTEEADSHLERALELRRGLLGAEHPGVGRVTALLAENAAHAGELDRAQQLAEQAIAVLGPAGPDYVAAHVTALLTLGRVHRVRDAFAAAEASYREALRAIERPGTAEPEYEAAVHNGLGALFLEMGDLERARSELERAMEIARALTTARRVDVASQLANLGSALFGAGDVRAADDLWGEALAVFEKALPGDHPLIATLLSNRAMAVGSAEIERAIELHRRALAIRRSRYPDGHVAVTQSLDKLGWILIEAGTFDEAAEHLRSSLALKERLLATRQHPQVAVTLGNLGFLHAKTGRPELAVRFLEESLEIFRAKLPPGNAHVSRTLSLLALARADAGDAAGAETVAREAYELRRAHLPEGSWLTANSRSIYGACLTVAGRYDEAEPHLVEALHSIARERGARDVRTREALERVERLFEAWGRPERAAEQREWLESIKE